MNRSETPPNVVVHTVDAVHETAQSIISARELQRDEDRDEEEVPRDVLVLDPKTGRPEAGTLQGLIDFLFTPDRESMPFVRVFMSCYCSSLSPLQMWNSIEENYRLVDTLLKTGQQRHVFKSHIFSVRFSLFAFRFSLFAFRFSLFAFRFSLFAFRFSSERGF
jgi:hypothetical protein